MCAKANAGVTMPPREGPKTQQLNLLLLRRDVADFESALEAPGDLDALDLVDGLPFAGRLFVQRRVPHPPAWLGFVQEGVADDIGELANAGTAAVLFIRAQGRIFAMTFGYGRSLLKPESFVRDFGLKVVLNVVDPDRLRSVELRVVEEMVISRRTDASRAASPSAFGLNPGQDIMRGVTGQPRDRALYGRQIVGSDAVVARLKVSFAQLGDVASRLLAAYEDTVYLQRFAWIDDVKIVKDSTLVDELDEALLDGLRTPPGEPPYLAPPEMLPWNNVEFAYTGGRGERHDDLDLADYLSNIDIGTLDIERLRRHHIQAFPVGAAQEQTHWTVYSCLVFEARRGDQSFVLSEGQWFEVASTLVELVRNGLATIPATTLAMPTARDGEWEAQYNQRAANADPTNRSLMDTVLSRVASEHGMIEMCDLFTAAGQFVHVKRKTQSATLSHLFAQGRIAGEVFKRDPGVRDEMRARLEPTHHALAALIPDATVGRFDVGGFEIVYGVITTRPAGFPGNLPFFSRLNLWRAYEYLTATLGYRASIAAIGIDP